jgi:hypothetical protein
MFVANNFKKLANLDILSESYLNFSNALLAVRWDSVNLAISAKVLSYAPGFSFSNIPFMNNHPGFKNKWGSKDNSDANKEFDIVNVRKHSLPFFSMIESLMPNHRVIRSEVLAQLPKKVDRKSEIKQIHIDHRVFHRYAKRCQIVIATNNDSFLNVGHQQISLPVGSLFEFNNKECHWGCNYGDSIRIATVVDLLDIDVWNQLDQYTKEQFFEPDDPKIIAIDDNRIEEFILEFKAKHELL